MKNQERVRDGASRRGFTVVEVLVAMMIMTIAVLALASSSGLVAKMMTRGHNAEMATSFSMRRMEDLRWTGCTVRANGADTLFRGGSNWAAVNSWVWSDGGNNTWRVKMTTTYRSGGLTGTNVSESSIRCVI
jgi:prepilin-type N-terminal cleavage/methylation domain-containing protein